MSASNDVSFSGSVYHYNSYEPQDTSSQKKMVSIRATRRILAPYVKARKKPKVEVKENKYFSYYVQKKPSILMKVMCSINSDLHAIMDETAQVLREITDSAGVTVYLVDETSEEIYQVTQNFDIHEHRRVSFKIEKGSTVAAHVAYTKYFVNIPDVLEDVRFPHGIGNFDLTVKSVICVPVMNPENECIAVFELYRDFEDLDYDDRDLRIVITTCAWIGAANYQNQQKVTLRKQQELSEYLLDLTACYFGDAMLLDKLITEVVNFAKVALNAEHGIFYVLRPVENDEIFADIYEECGNSSSLYKKILKIKLVDANDFVGIAAQKGLALNIKNAFTDSRVPQNKKDYKIRTVLCTPIKFVGETLGVIAIFNKEKQLHFEKSDEILLQTFSDYCGFVLMYARQYNHMSKLTSLNNVYLEMLESHMRPCIHDTNFITNHPEMPSIPDKFNQFDFYISESYELYMPQLVMYMINKISHDLFENIDILGKFVLVVQKNYSNNLPYHNFHHAFNVCHCMYNILRRNIFLFSKMEVRALIVASICHDVCHFGVSNSYLEITRNSISELYEDSKLENYHFHITSMIFKFLKLFSYMSVDEYKQFISEIRECILATDLASHFKKRTRLEELYIGNTFDFHNDTHRALLKSIIMTTADLSGLTKPFPIAKNLTDNLYGEFYNEGDKLKRIGLCPISLMNRDLPNMVAVDQINFLNAVLMPCTKLVAKILPNCEPIYCGARQVREGWVAIFESHGQKLWAIEEYFA